jgi:hypothetical protein
VNVLNTCLLALLPLPKLQESRRRDDDSVPHLVALVPRRIGSSCFRRLMRPSCRRG